MLGPWCPSCGAREVVAVPPGSEGRGLWIRAALLAFGFPAAVLVILALIAAMVYSDGGPS
jgi:hypothetical protein